MFQNYMRRLFWLILGVAVSSVGIAMMLQANVGLEPWSVLQQGMSLRTGMTYGTASAIAGAAAILTAVFFGESFGLGTIINIAGCAVIIDAIQAAHLIPQMHGLVSGIAMLIGGLELLALGTWLYMKSALGSGPRDALMVALARKFGRSAGACRAVVDVLVTVIGFFLGGPIGVGTIISAVGLGPLINLNFAAVRFRPAKVHQENVAETIARITGKRLFSIFHHQFQFICGRISGTESSHSLGLPFSFAYAQNSPVKHKNRPVDRSGISSNTSAIGNGGSVQRAAVCSYITARRPGFVK